ncbi:hypothetical protein NLJ89_g8682 [Agrocybe chaxingu]|uniref:BTB domain-containing protein n=1 Tax=Agrocybe chaxingu TaxID=84603 RepID=A0A9W8MSJ1_9AGAR|nr:hypothetical protein NLJ89_g8682 [Agrocybe chaxingu]
MSEPASKRRRTESGVEEGSESDSENQTAMKVKRSKYWFDDGNVVLQAENTQFRVHRSMMAHHSKVFKDMFGMPQPEQAQDAMVDGCPVVILGDEPRDVELVLAVFYDNVKALDFRKKMTVFQLGAYLQLGKKYEIEYLQNEALKHMRGDYPTTLDGWDETFERQNIDSNKIRLSGVARSVILFGHSMFVLSVLPAAYFTYVVYSSPIWI